MSDWVYLGLGSNMGDSVATLEAALKKIEKIQGVQTLEVSPFFRTTPVSAITQRDFINCACRLKTFLKPDELFIELQAIEILLGKRPKDKDAPRPIDIDILLFKEEQTHGPDLIIPHPRFKERLFVLVPLSHLTDEIICPIIKGQNVKINLEEYLSTFSNPNHETVFPLKKTEVQGHHGGI